MTSRLVRGVNNRVSTAVTVKAVVLSMLRSQSLRNPAEKPPSTWNWLISVNVSNVSYNYGFSLIQFSLLAY